MMSSHMLGDAEVRNQLTRQFFCPGISSELERLFLPDILSPMTRSSPSLPVAMPMASYRDRHGSGAESASSSPGSSVSPWDEFQTNGRDEDLDELDRLVRGMEIHAEPVPELEIPLPIHGIAYPPLSVSPGSASDTSDSSLGSMDGILTKARLLEILRERERDRMARRRLKVKGDKICVFCRNNGESEAVYSTHQLKDAQGRVTCPVLYIYTCPICGASGEAAHTIKYCPLNTQDRKKGSCCRSPRNSVGKRR